MYRGLKELKETPKILNNLRSHVRAALIPAVLPAYPGRDYIFPELLIILLLYL